MPADSPKEMQPQVATLFEPGWAFTNAFVGSTPTPFHFWVSLTGSETIQKEHRSNNPRTHHVTIHVATLTPAVKLRNSRCAIEMSRFGFLKGGGKWKTWSISDQDVKYDPGTRTVTAEFDLKLDGDAVLAGWFDYTVELLVSIA